MEEGKKGSRTGQGKETKQERGLGETSFSPIPWGIIETTTKVGLLITRTQSFVPSSFLLSFQSLAGGTVSCQPTLKAPMGWVHSQ